MSISVSKIVNLQQAALKFLVRDEITSENHSDESTLGGILSDTNYSWLAKGAHLEVINNKNGNKAGAWTFGWILKDFETRVACVGEITRSRGRLPLLAVGVNYGFTGGMMCIFDFVTSRVIRAIQVNEKITSLHVVDSGNDIFTLPSHLRNFDGIIAIGTSEGKVYLIDICRQICDESLGEINEIRDELNPCRTLIITSNELYKIELHKQLSVKNCEHLSIHLNAVFDKSTKHFILKGPKGDNRIFVNREEVVVSSLHYCPQLGSLLVGYNFGAFQLFNLMNLHLIYTSPISEEHIPITHFAIQEPADDPRVFCYIWTVYSSDYHDTLPLAVMYAFCYKTKEYHEGYGFLFQDFQYATVPYQMELDLTEEKKGRLKPKGGQCLGITSLNRSTIPGEIPHIDSIEDNLTLCTFSWKIWITEQKFETFFSIFDLNQWYKEQMPSVSNWKYCSNYLFQICLSDLLNTTNDKILDVFDVTVPKKSLHQFTGTQRLEEHFCPNSLSFDLCCLRNHDLIVITNLGVQKSLLAQIESAGPLCFIEPSVLYQQIIASGLTPLFVELPLNSSTSLHQQREIILNTALEHQLIGWLCKCAVEWANGSFLSAACSFEWLINWAFERVMILKSNCDDICVPLFDYSETRLDTNAIILLNNCTRQISNICTFYSFILRKLNMFLPNIELVEEQFKSLQMISMYFDVLQWLLNVGLLPEWPITSYPRTDERGRINAPYPAEILSDFYNHRRALLKIDNERQFNCNDSSLFIDSLIDYECGGKKLLEQWKNDGGNGLYPPQSLQSLLRTYLVDHVQFFNKHSVIIYLFLDLAMTLDQNRYKSVITHLIKFPAVFKISPSVIKITQAFWQLDHGDCNTAVGLLLDPLVLPEDLKYWHHKIALKSLVLQNQHNFALLYLQVRKPVIDNDDDILISITLYVTNNMLDEAFYFMRNIQTDKENTFFCHLLDECKRGNLLKTIISRCLSHEEEHFLLNYLQNCKEGKIIDLSVFYHLIRSQHIEAFESHERITSNRTQNQGLGGQLDASPVERFMQIVKKLLPEVHRNLLIICRTERNNIWREVSRPTPMSVFVHNANENVQYKSTILGAALAKAKQTFNDTLSNKHIIISEETPFLRTPVVVHNPKRTSTKIVNPKIVSIDEDGDDFGPTPRKQLKLSPSSPVHKNLTTSILDTPIVKRKSLKTPPSSDREKFTVYTPQSILKNGRNSVVSQNDNFEDGFEAFEKLSYTPVKIGLGLSPRKSLARTPSSVRFENVKKLSLDSSKSVEETGVSQNVSNSGCKEEDLFYSLDNSLETEKAVKEIEKEKEVMEIEKEKDVMEIEKEQKVIEIEKAKEVNEIEKKEQTISKETIHSPVFSPKSRRSYKRIFNENVPVRSSPRLSKNMETNVILETKETSHELTPIDSPQKLITVSKRKPLCRQVLENIAKSKIESPRRSSRKRRSSFSKNETETTTTMNDLTKSNTVGVKVITETVTESRFEESFGSEISEAFNFSSKSEFLESSYDSTIHEAETEPLGLSESFWNLVRKPHRNLRDTSLQKEESTLNKEELCDKVSVHIHEGNIFQKTITTEVENNQTRNSEFPTEENKLEESIDKSIDLYKDTSARDVGDEYFLVITDNVDTNVSPINIYEIENNPTSMANESQLRKSDSISEIGEMNSCSNESNKLDIRNEDNLFEKYEYDNAQSEIKFDNLEVGVDSVEIEINEIEEEEEEDVGNTLNYGQLQNDSNEISLSNSAESSYEAEHDESSAQSSYEAEHDANSAPSSYEAEHDANSAESSYEAEHDANSAPSSNEIIEIDSSSEEENQDNDYELQKSVSNDTDNTLDSFCVSHSSDEDSWVPKISNIKELDEEKNTHESAIHYNESSNSNEDSGNEGKLEGINTENSELNITNKVKERIANNPTARRLTRRSSVTLDNVSDTLVYNMHQNEYLMGEPTKDDSCNSNSLCASHSSDEDSCVPKISNGKESDEEKCKDKSDMKHSEISNPREESGNEGNKVEEKIEDISTESMELNISSEVVELAEDNPTKKRLTRRSSTLLEKQEASQNPGILDNISHTSINEMNRDEYLAGEHATDNSIDSDNICHDEKCIETSTTVSTRITRSGSRKANYMDKCLNEQKPCSIDILNKPDLNTENESNVNQIAESNNTINLNVDKHKKKPLKLPRVKKQSIADQEQATTAVNPKKRSWRSTSASQLPKIAEEDIENVKTKKSNSVIEGYSSTRRMTRRQMQILQNTMKDTGNLTEDSLKIEAIDPLVLLDKLSFAGKVDVDEKRFYDTSSSISNASVSQRRSQRQRSTSVSDISSVSNPSTSTTVTGIKGRLRKASTDDLSTKSDSTPAKRTRKNKSTSINNSNKKSSRSNSFSLDMPSTSQGIGRKNPAISVLPEIPEEPVKPATRRRRKNSTQV